MCYQSKDIGASGSRGTRIFENNGLLVVGLSSLAPDIRKGQNIMDYPRLAWISIVAMNIVTSIVPLSTAKVLKSFLGDLSLIYLDYVLPKTCTYQISCKLL